PAHIDPSFVVRNKLLNNASYKLKLQDPEHLMSTADALSNEKKLKETYLSTTWARTKEILSDAVRIQEPEEEVQTEEKQIEMKKIQMFMEGYYDVVLPKVVSVK